jgi:hypothetical protein
VKIDSYISGFFMISAATLVAILGLLIVRRALRTNNLISSHEVGGYLLAIINYQSGRSAMPLP